MEGVIVRLVKERGFGFIKGNRDGVEYFFHMSKLKNCRFEDLEQGREVIFEDAEGSKGPIAEDIYV